ncbi:hypothetical protein [Bartonella bovis]|uniref:hypothetical protein n=2 Tax=Bartonella bovis TaxID=155194 RepID=UPI0003B71A30|nr:hypothetical protein [Bartonella bovis]
MERAWRSKKLALMGRRWGQKLGYVGEGVISVRGGGWEIGEMAWEKRSGNFKHALVERMEVVFAW